MAIEQGGNPIKMPSQTRFFKLSIKNNIEWMLVVALCILCKLNIVKWNKDLF